jgi:hypothetical protein
VGVHVGDGIVKSTKMHAGHEKGKERMDRPRCWAGEWMGEGGDEPPATAEMHETRYGVGGRVVRGGRPDI